MKEARCLFAAVCIKGEIYVFGGIYYNKIIKDGVKIIKPVVKHFPDSNTWKHVNYMVDDRQGFTACSFINNVYISGGRMSEFRDKHDTATCFEFDSKSLKWKEILRMYNARLLPASSVFKGRIIVSGGSNNIASLNTVEAYDHVGDTWEIMPNMINERDGHKSIAVKNKLFVIGGLNKNNFEVFDSATEKFTLLKQPMFASGFYLYGLHDVITIGSKLFVLFLTYDNIKIYDVKNDDCSEKLCEATKNIRGFSCARVPSKTC